MPNIVDGGSEAYIFCILPNPWTDSDTWTGTGALSGGSAKEVGGFEVTWDDIAKFPGGLLREVGERHPLPVVVPAWGTPGSMTHT